MDDKFFEELINDLNNAAEESINNSNRKIEILNSINPYTLKRDYKNKLLSNYKLIFSLLKSSNKQERELALIMIRTNDYKLMAYYNIYIDILVDYFKLKEVVENHEVKIVPLDENLYVKALIELVKKGLNDGNLEKTDINELLLKVNSNTESIRSKAIIKYHAMFLDQYDRNEFNSYFQKEVGYTSKTENDKNKLITIIQKAKTEMNKANELNIEIKNLISWDFFGDIMLEITKYRETLHTICEEELGKEEEYQKNKKGKIQ